MFTDIVGYTVLMGSDEDKAFDMLKRNHSIHEILIKKYNGTLIKEVVDGTLASFPLASEAVRCAIEIQKEAKDQNIPLKIGVHQGEMVMAGSDVLGDGVNVASRLQEASEEGCITISGKVYSDIKNKADIATNFIGDKTLKGVDEPVKVYSVLCEEQEQRESRTPADGGIGGQQATNKIKILYILLAVVIIIITLSLWYFQSQKQHPVLEKSIAVRPFWNESTDPENEPFVNGITEDIRTGTTGMEVDSGVRSLKKTLELP